MSSMTEGFPRAMKRLLLVVAGCQSFFLMAEDLELTADRTIDVAAGETADYDALTGGEFTLTKTGEGMLRFKAIANADASIVIEGGTVKVAGETVAPAAFLSADMWFDASAANSFKLKDGTVAPAGWAGPVGNWLGAGGTVDGRFLSNEGNSFRPFLIDPADTVNGLPLVDFGSQRKQDNSDSISVPGQGGFAALLQRGTKNTTSMDGLVELMIVASDTENVKNTIAAYGIPANNENSRATPFLGSDTTPGQICFGRCERSQTGVNSGIQHSGSSFDYVAKGGIKVDGVAAASSTPYPDGLHLLELLPTCGVRVVYLATDRMRWTGGVRLGAVAGWRTKLSAADRAAARNYLLTRWVPAPVKRLELKNGATLAFENAAGIHAATLACSGSSTLSGGTLTCDVEESASGTITPTSGVWRYGVGARGKLPTCAHASGNVYWQGGWYDNAGFSPASTPWFHVDASVSNTVSTETTSGTNFVTKWKDVDGGNVYAGLGRYRKPFVRRGFLNGRDVVDFGAYMTVNGTGNVVGGWGGNLDWYDKANDNKITCTNVREVFTVASDTEDLIDNYANIQAGGGDHYKRGAPFVGNSSSPHFIRGNRSGGDSLPPMLLPSVVPYSTTTIDLDGTNVAKSAAYPQGFHLVNIRSGQDGCYGNCFANDRSWVYGGTRIAEFYVFTSELSADEREKLSGKLMTKWLGKESIDLVPYAQLTVGAAADYAAPAIKVSVTGDFTLKGKMAVDTVEVGGKATFATNAVFDGRLRLKAGSALALGEIAADADAPARTFDKLALEGGTVTVDFGTLSRLDFYGKTVPLFAAGSLTGEAAFAAGGSFANHKTDFTWQDGVLYVKLQPKGMTVNLR